MHMFCRAEDEEVEIDLSWGLSSLFKAPQASSDGQDTMLDKLRSELQRWERVEGLSVRVQ